MNTLTDLATRHAARDNPQRVLVVDDDADFADSLVDLLELRGYAAATASRLAEAIRQCGEFAPQVALVDLRLGQESGIDVIRELRARDPLLVCVMITAFAEVDTAVKAIRLGAYDYLSKPLNDGQLVALLSRAFDKVTLEREKHELAAQLRQAQKLEAVGLLAGGIAHDFNNLLTAIHGYTELARAALPANHPALEALTGVTDAAMQAAGVTRALLTFSHKGQTHKRPTDLVEVVADSIRFLRRTLPSSIEIIADLPTDDPHVLNADPTQLQQVIMNLAVNARDAMPGGGTLRMALQRRMASEAPALPAEEPEIVLAVSDTGIGIPADIRERIFEPFYSTKSAGQGTGLGLSIIHGIVADHGGRIAVQSTVGRGTTFTITLPGTAEPIPSPPEAPQPLCRSGQGEVILLAEDDRQIRRIIASALRDAGYDVVQAEDGDALVEAFGEHESRVRGIVTDIDMPKQSGLAALTRIRGRGSAVPAVVITAIVDEDFEDQFDEHTVLLRKPFSIMALADLVARMCRSAGT